MHICVTHGHRQQCSEGWGVQEWGGMGQWGKKKGDICKTLKNKNN